MKLSRALIINFRSIERVEINFENACQFLVGINEAGKTNVLKALKLLNTDTLPTSKDQRRPLDSETFNSVKEVTFEFDLTNVERHQFEKEVRSTFLCKSIKETVLCNQLGKELTLDSYASMHRCPIYWCNLTTLKKYFGGYQNLPTSIARGWYKLKADAAGQEVLLPDGSKKVLDSFDVLYQPDWPEIAVETLDPLTPIQLSQHFTSRFKKLFEASKPPCIFWAYEEKYLLPSSINLAQFSDDPSTCVPLQHMFALAEITDIKKTIETQRGIGTNALRSLLERVASRATKHVKSVWKENKNIEIKLELNGDSVDASVVDHFNRYDFFDRSDGFKRFISLLLVLSAQARTSKLKDTLILIDEGENGLHPSGVRYLRDELIKIAESNLVIVSTHSIFMIDKKKIDRHLIVKKIKETTEITKVDVTNIFEEEVIYNALNYSVFENLKPFNLIFEGWRDQRIFDVSLNDKRSPEQAAIRLKASGWCHLQGVGDAGRVVPMLELADRAYMIISDSDEAAIKAKSRFKGNGAWLTYKDLGSDAKTFLTSEDFVKAEPINKLLQKIANENNVSPLVLDDDAKRKPRIPQIRSWMQKLLGLEGEPLKDLLNQVKEDIFIPLKPSQISDEYFEVLAKISASLPDLETAGA